MKTHFTPHGYDAGLSGPVLATGLKSTIETKEWIQKASKKMAEATDLGDNSTTRRSL